MVSLRANARTELTHQQGLPMLPNPQPGGAYRQVHKEFNRVDLMREQRRRRLSMLWIFSPLHPSR